MNTMNIYNKYKVCEIIKYKFILRLFLKKEI